MAIRFTMGFTRGYSSLIPLGSFLQTSPFSGAAGQRGQLQRTNTPRKHDKCLFRAMFLCGNQFYSSEKSFPISRKYIGFQKVILGGSGLFRYPVYQGFHPWLFIFDPFRIISPDESSLWSSRATWPATKNQYTTEA